MATPPGIGGPGPAFVGEVPVDPGFVSLVLVALVVFALLYAQRPQLTETVVWAFVPWLFIGSVLHVLATVGEYPAPLGSILATPIGPLAVVVVPGLVWLGLLSRSKPASRGPAVSHYLGAMGAGALAVVVGFLLVSLDGTQLSRLLVLVGVAMGSFLATVVLVLAAGLASPSFLEDAALSGAFVVFAAVVSGIAEATSVMAVEPVAHTVLTAAATDVGALLLRVLPVGVAETHLWLWLFVLAYLSAGIVIATRVGARAHTNPQAVRAVHGLVGGIALTVGFTNLVRLVVG